MALSDMLIFGGTTEGLALVKALDAINIPYHYSTKTPTVFLGKGVAMHGAMDADKISTFCREKGIKTIINAAHPFAILLDKALQTLKNQVHLVRLERAYSDRIQHPLIHYFDDYDAMISQAKRLNPKCTLALTGVQTIATLQSYWEAYPTYFRILDRPYSKQLASNHDFPKRYLLYGKPQQAHDEIALLKSLDVSLILTKESGYNGKLPEKITAAIQTDTPLFILKRPMVAACYECFSDISELLKKRLDG